MRTSLKPGASTDRGTSATSAFEPQNAIMIPNSAATPASARLSESSCAARRARPAPSAIRTAISRRRDSERASNRLATLTHAISSTTPTSGEQEDERRFRAAGERAHGADVA